MPRAVYGKSKARSAFSVSNIFTDSSPSRLAPRSVTRPAAQDVPDTNDILKTIEKLEVLDIQDESPDSLPLRRQRKPLSRRDRNSRPTSKHGEGDEKRTKSRMQTQTRRVEAPVEETLCQKDMGTKGKDMSQSSPVALSSLYDLCDEYIRPLVELTNEQRIPLAFEAWSDALIPHFSISKIAEASYSEVYRISLLDDHPTLTAADESVLKVMRVRPQPSSMKKTPAQKRREDDMSSVKDVVSEVRLLKRMTTVPGFTNYRALHILRGRPSKPFVQAWKEWQKSRRKGEKSEFPDPSRKANYDEDQYWAVIEMQDAGTDVEKLIEDETKAKEEISENESLRSVWSVWDIFWQTVLAVAKGESEARFEHRDLHLGNICVRRKGNEMSIDDSHHRMLGFTNFEATIIDYTLSRADMSSHLRRRAPLHPNAPEFFSSSEAAVSAMEAEVAYNPLGKQPKIFEGDAEVEYQYEIYRYMRSIVDSSLCLNCDQWRSYQPRTNLLWLHFVLFKLCETMRWPSDSPVKKKDKKQRKALDLEGVLVQVEDLVAVERLLGEEDCPLASAADLVAVALEQGWLNDDDINA